MDTSNILIWGIVYGAIGLGFLSYGKKQRKLIPFASGIGFMTLPYMMPSLPTLLLAGLALLALPYFLRL